ncbi:MAG: nucleotide exchange factor GrpE [Patescibacteria group bacterium]
MTKKTDEQFVELQKQAEEWKSKYLRALADYQNLEKRSGLEKAEIRGYAAQSVITRLLPVVDTLERAQKHLEDSGLALVLKELDAFFASQGVVKFMVAGALFDPGSMECIEVVDGEDNVVVQELLPGYMLHGKIIRVAQVKVGKKNTI